MRNMLFALVVAGILVLGMAGCGKQGQQTTAGTGHGQKDEASEFQDGAEKYFPAQMKCPVCGGKPIQGQFYVDAEKGRIYFDKEECVRKFKKNKEKYKKKLDTQIEDYMSGGG